MDVLCAVDACDLTIRAYTQGGSGLQGRQQGPPRLLPRDGLLANGGGVAGASHTHISPLLPPFTHPQLQPQLHNRHTNQQIYYDASPSFHSPIHNWTSNAQPIHILPLPLSSVYYRPLTPYTNQQSYYDPDGRFHPAPASDAVTPGKMALGNLGLELVAYIHDPATDTHAILARGRLSCVCIHCYVCVSLSLCVYRDKEEGSLPWTFCVHVRTQLISHTYTHTLLQCTHPQAVTPWS